VAIRNIRRDAIEQIKRMKKDGLSEDLAVDAEGEVQKLTDAHIAQVERHIQAKEKEIMSI
jgi:ribosome recycling factor